MRRETFIGGLQPVDTREGRESESESESDVGMMQRRKVAPGK